MNDNQILAADGPADAPLRSQRVLFHRLLVVEDDTSLRRLSTGVLVRSGYVVDAVEDGAAAWEALQADSYDLMITDNNMPNLTGIELLKKLYAARMALPFIMTSGQMPEEEFTQCPWLHPAATLLKPYSIVELLETVKEALSKEEINVDGHQRCMHLDRKDNQISPVDSPVEKPAGATRQRPTNPPRRILVVDDYSDTRQLSVDVLAGSGYEVEAVLDGAAGWEALQDTRYDLVITDNKMPRMTGIEMIEKLRSARMTLPVIMATGHLPMNEFARRPWLKPDAMLQRPFSNDDLLETVQKILHPDDNEDGREEALVPQPL